MNTILQKRIEEAARSYADSLALPEWDKRSIHAIDFKKGAVTALQKQWISVDEALPEEKKLGDSDFVFVKTSIRFPFLACYSYKHETWKNINHVAIHGVTHWMYIPIINNEEK